MASFPSPEQADRLGRAVLRQRLRLRPKERVTIESYPTSLPWAAGFVREARRLGAYPIVHYEDEASYWDAAEHGRAGLIGALPAHEAAALGETDAYVFFWGPEDLDRRDRLPESAQESLFSFNPRWYELAKKAGLRGARMGIARATPANARRYGVPLARWQSQLYGASLEDPARLAPTALKIARALGGRGEVRLTHPNGTDLTLALDTRPVQQATGLLPPPSKRGLFGRMVNVPDGSVYVSIDESTADGTLVANRPTNATGPSLEGGRWTFKDGRLVGHRYRRGDRAFTTQFGAATGAKDRPAFLEVGVVPGLEGVPLLEENELGSVTVGIGGNGSFGGKNRSTLFQFLSLAGATLTVGGRAVVRAGRPR